MLNELYTLALALKKRNLLAKTTHPDINKIGKCECLLVEIDKNKLPHEIRFLQKNETINLWKHSKGNHNNFPAIKIQSPLLIQTVSKDFDNQLKNLEAESNTEPSEIWEKQKIEIKKNLLSKLNRNEINTETHKLKLQDYTRQQLEPSLNCEQDELKALKFLLQRFPTEDKEEKEFIKHLIEKIYNQISETNEKKLLDFFKLLLVGKRDKKSKKFVSGCMLYFDIYETDEVYCKVIDPETKNALIRLLNNVNENTENNIQSENIGFCALSGQKQELIIAAYPQPKLPLLGNTYLYSKNTSAIPCLVRYRLNGSNAYTASKETVNSINDALAFLTKPENENKTWKYIASSNRKEPNLLLAYLEVDPQNDALLAEILDEPTDIDEQEDTFNNLCSQVLDKTQDISRKNPKSKINLIILEKLDKGRKQILYANSLTVEQFRENLLRWEKASQNYPPIKISVWNKKTRKDYESFNSIFPSGICNLLKVYYRLNKNKKTSKISLENEKQQTSAISISEVYHLYMPQNENEEKDDILFLSVLERTLKKTNFMLSTIRQQNILNNFSVSFDSALMDAFNSISLISILLWKLNIKKENYMNDIPFNIGQFLQCADLLHKEYCIQVRNKGKKERLPNQLIGNQLLPIATQKPNDGLCRIGDRLRIYIAWARTYENPDPERSKKVKWILARYREVSERIHACEKEIPETFNTAEQAQVLLGYLATIPYEKKEETDKKQ